MFQTPKDCQMTTNTFRFASYLFIILILMNGHRADSAEPPNPLKNSEYTCTYRVIQNEEGVTTTTEIPSATTPPSLHTYTKEEGVVKSVREQYTAGNTIIDLQCYYTKDPDSAEKSFKNIVSQHKADPITIDKIVYAVLMKSDGVMTVYHSGNQWGLIKTNNDSSRSIRELTKIMLYLAQTNDKSHQLASEPKSEQK